MFRVVLEVELVLHVDPVFDEVPPEPRLAFKRKPVRCAPAASHREVGVVDDEPIVIGAVEAVVDGGAELLRQIMFLLGRGVQDPIAHGEFEFSGDDVFPDLRIPTPGLAEIHRGALDCRYWDRCEVEGNSSTVLVPYSLVPIVPFSLEGPAL